MTALRTRVARAVVALYPRDWRSRYGAELLELVEDAGLRPADVVDLLAGAVRQHAHQLRGGRTMDSRINPLAAGVAALTAVALATPTAVFIALNLGGLSVDWSPVLKAILPGLPVAALGVAISPAIAVRLSRSTAEIGAVTVGLRAMPWWLTGVAAACALLVAAVLGFGISDAILEARR